MEERLNPQITRIPPSGIRKFFDVVNEMPDAISLGVGEPDFVTPWNIREAAMYSLEQGKTQYTSNSGMPQLREAICRYLKTRFQVEYDWARETLITVGASEGIDLAMRAVLQPGDEVLVPDPSYVSYDPCVRMAYGVTVPIKTRAREGFKLMPEDVLRAITPRTKAIIVPYPNNPTGGVMERQYLQDLAAALEKTDLVVISDEIYGELTYTEQGHVSIASMPGMRERTVLLSGFSKCLAMTGWRVGYACGPAPLIAAMTKIHQYTMLCAPIMGQNAALEGIESEMEHGYREMARMRRQYNRRRRIMLDGFARMGMDCFEPMGAFYAFPSIAATGMTSDEFCERLLY
ncbi:MAG: aminotransferase class I/II-fold pyridoxal phosphate-dependent enzyme, partial [Christensenellaceae bacterium]